MRLLLTVLVASAVLSAGAIYAATLSGSVMNRQGEPIAGVNVSIEGSQSAAITDDNGRFTFTTDRRLPLSLTFSHISFQPVMVRVTSGDFLKVEMDYAVYPLQGITVTGNRAAAGLTPIAFTDFTARELERDYLIGEFPLLLEVTPNVYAYTDAGGGLGYSYLRIRGFDDKRVAVYINGVPLNDPEDQATYFVDLPDFASTVKDIQVQRGIGNSLYGDASFGGSVNIVSAGIDQQRHIAVESGFGGFWSGGDWVGDMEKQSFEYHSGLIDGRWNFSGRYSRQISDGYREGSWYNGWAYYLSLSRLDPRMTTTVNVYGGPMRMHLAYYGISRSQIDENRRFNPLTYENETDNFNQPHYEVHNTARLGNRTTLHNTLFHIHGSGYYEQYKKRAKYSAYDLPTDQLQRGDLVRQKWVRKNQWGWNPTLEIEQSRGTLTVGGQFYYFESDHWGQVVWAEGLSNEIAPQHRYYQYYGDKLFGALYAVQTYRATDRLNLTGNLQLRHQSYDFDQVRMGPFPGYDYNVNWTFVSPRLGLTYNINPKTNLLFSYALSSRSPADYEIYEAGDPGAFPSLEVKEVRFVSSTDSTVIFGDPTMKAEKVHNFELGVDVRDDQQAYGVNLFWMEFRDEIVQFGGINEMGLPINTNVDRSVHAGGGTIRCSEVWRAGAALRKLLLQLQPHQRIRDHRTGIRQRRGLRICRESHVRLS